MRPLSFFANPTAIGANAAMLSTATAACRDRGPHSLPCAPVQYAKDRAPKVPTALTLPKAGTELTKRGRKAPQFC
jgi:hypothetical protein